MKHHDRIDRLRKRMTEEQVPALLITNETNRRYMTGFTGSAGYVVITENRAVLLTDFRYMTQAPAQATAFEVVEHAPKHAETIAAIMAEEGLHQLGFEQHDLTYSAYQNYVSALPGIELVPTDGWIEALRMIKDQDEIAILKEAAQLADRTFSHVLSILKPGIMEQELALEIEMFVRRNGASSTSFETIVASGERSALPHGKASDRVLGNHEFVKFDFGALYKGYCSDITRTVMLGTPTDKHKEIYSIVLEAQLAALDGIKPGMTGKEADSIAREVIKKHGYGDYFGHGLGHAIGMEIHEAPRLSPAGEIVLQPGMTVTVEPGIYLPGFGGVRIEDDIIITESGIEVITGSTKELITI